MRLELSSGSCVHIDLRATGLFRAVGHDPTLVARPGPLVLDVGDGEIAASFALSFPADALELPEGLSPADRERMRENLHGREVLDTARFPEVLVKGRYEGTLHEGTLAATVALRGVDYAVQIPLRTKREGAELTVTGAWEGRLTTLGIKPFKALFGALRLDDWVRLRLDARLYLSL